MVETVIHKFKNAINRIEKIHCHVMPLLHPVSTDMIGTNNAVKLVVSSRNIAFLVNSTTVVEQRKTYLSRWPSDYVIGQWVGRYWALI